MPHYETEPFDFRKKVLQKLVEPTANRVALQMDEARQQGVPEERILATLIQIYNPQTGQTGTINPQGLSERQIQLGKPGSQQPTQTQQPQQQQPQDRTSLLKSLMSGLFAPQQINIDPSTGAAAVQPGGLLARAGEGARVALGMPSAFDTAGKIQKLAGEEPLQRGEREKIGLETQRALYQELLKQENAGMLSPNDVFTAFNRASQPFIISRDAHARLEAAAKDASPAGDLAVIFNYMKILDPNSTVREGEFATAQNSGAVPDRIWNTYNRLLRGERLAKRQRADFLDRGRRLFSTAEDQMEKTTTQYRSLATRNGIDPNRVTLDVGLVQEQAQQQQQGTLQSGISYRVVQ